MQPFAIHCFQGCRGSLKSVSKILGVSCPPLLHWCSRFCMWCSTARHYWTLTTSIPELVMHQFWGWVVHRCYTDVRSVACAAQQLRTIESCPVISPTRTSIHRYASFCNAPFSRMQSIPEKFMIHLTQLNTILSNHVRWSTRMLNSLQQDIPNWSKKSLKIASMRYKPYQWSKSLIKYKHKHH